MDRKTRLIKNLKRLRKNEFYSRLIKIILLAIIILLTPITIFEKIRDGDFMTGVVLLIAELFLIGIGIMFLKSALEFYDIKNSRIYQCIENKGAVTEIVVTPIKIVFEIKGMEDETIFLKPSKFRTEFIKNITEVFGEKKIANIINN